MSEDFKLSDEQLEAFDNEFRDWPGYERFLRTYGAGRLPERILDVGGGNGKFLDRVLDVFPDAHGVMMDNAQYMLDCNEAHPRKTLSLGSATALNATFSGQSFDLITINVLLHHLVEEGERRTREQVGLCLEQARSLLRPGGRIVVYEQVYEGFVVEPGRLIYELTTVKNPLFAKVMNKLGANTAGIGVRFRSKSGWRELFANHGLLVLNESEVYEDHFSLFRRVGLNIRWVGAYLFMLEAALPSSQAK